MNSILGPGRRSGVLIVAAALLSAIPASARIGPWIEADVVDIRLVATAGADGAAPVAALEIVLAPGWKTYWRTPGEGGLPPILDFSESRNLLEATVGYPPPHRYNDSYSITNVYEGRVVLPIELVPEVAGAPVTVHLRFDLGVCETICIPFQIETSVTFSTGETDLVALALHQEGRAHLPSPPIPGEFEVVRVDRAAEDGLAAEYRATVIAPQPFGAELFVEGPVGWFAIAPHQIDRDGDLLIFGFGFERMNSEGPAISGTPVMFTLVSGGAAIEQTVELP